MDERSFRSNWADDLHKTFFARMQSPHEDFWHTVTIYIDEPHQILGTHMPQGSEYSFNARLDGIERESWWLTPRGSTRPFVPGMSVNFTARGSAYREQTGWVREGSVMVHLEKGSEAASKANATQQSVDAGGLTRKEGRSGFGENMSIA